MKKQQRAHLDAKARNEALMAKARERYDELCKAEREAHEENLERLREEYLAECEKLAADQEANYSRSHEDWKELCKLLEMKNKELMDVSRRCGFGSEGGGDTDGDGERRGGGRV